ncbi:MAG: type II toxin-antitoxin system Phd/YefM family antitoxin [Gemmatimonadaceae bacterium]
MTPTHESISISEFKATCLAVLERVRHTGQPILVTRRGEPIAEIMPPSLATTGSTWLGSMQDSATIISDIIEPVVDESHWDATGG